MIIVHLNIIKYNTIQGLTLVGIWEELELSSPARLLPDGCPPCGASNTDGSGEGRAAENGSGADAGREEKTINEIEKEWKLV